MKEEKREEYVKKNWRRAEDLIIAVRFSFMDCKYRQLEN
jgi:hypothetical protein